MASYNRRQRRDCVMIVGDESQQVAKNVFQSFRQLEKFLHRRLTLVVVVDHKSAKRKFNYPKGVIKVVVNTTSDSKVHTALMPYLERTMLATCRSEKLIPFFGKIIPHIPYARTPSVESLDWATDKILMRRRFTQYSKRITPSYTVVQDHSEKSISKIESKVGYPLVVKPASLAQSLLVSVCYHREDLDEALKKTFRKINSIYKSRGSKAEPKVLVEQLMEGTMYSIDGYVNSRGETIFTPPCHIKTGRAIGFDDFFGYLQITPTKLTPEEINRANEVVEQGVVALGLRSTTVHAELMRVSQKTWKIIEIGPRIGGFRDKMYELSFGFSHTFNDLLIRIPKKPVLSKKRLGYTATIKWFARKEGYLEKIQGLKKVRSLKSFHDISINKEKGEMCRFAKHGGVSVFNLTLHNKSRSELLADIRRVEQNVKVIVRPVKSSK